jgi:hypothetical protein
MLPSATVSNCLVLDGGLDLSLFTALLLANLQPNVCGYNGLLVGFTIRGLSAGEQSSGFRVPQNAGLVV